MTNAQPLVGRLAPSPTGAQHVGNARTYLLAWLSIRSRGGRVIVRMEDIDSPRVKRGAAEQAIEDLRWLGLDWDEGPDIGGPQGPYVQTERVELYRAAFKRLQENEFVYPCTCSRSDVEAAASAPHAGQEGPVYPGTCSWRRAAVAEALGEKPFCWRFRASPSEICFEDRIAGRQSIRGNDLGDFVIAKRDGSPSYQLAVVLDDHAMGVTEVQRGDDLIPSTFRQLQLYTAFGFTPPMFAHVPLVVGEDGRRLGKRHGDPRLSVLRAAHVSPDHLVGMIAWSSGLRQTSEPIAVKDLLANFDLSR